MKFKEGDRVRDVHHVQNFGEGVVLDTDSSAWMGLEYLVLFDGNTKSQWLRERDIELVEDEG